MKETLVLYVFHIYNERVQYFINNSIFKDDNIDFIIICNNKNLKIDIPDYVKIIYRDNIGYDFGAWSNGILENDLYKNYNNFIFCNSSIIGPFLRDKSMKWTDIYINGLQDNIKLFGSTINTCCYGTTIRPHVQSYIFSMNKETLEYLINCKIFSITEYTKTFNETVDNKEVGMSREIIKNNWNIGSLLNIYKDVDFTKSLSNIKLYDDIMYPQYRGVIWDEYDLVFIKGNRIPFNIS